MFRNFKQFKFNDLETN